MLSTIGLHLLPIELWIKILARLPLRDLLTYQRVTPLDAIIESSPTLQYIIELAAADVQDNPASPLTIAEKRRLLREHRDVANSLEDVTFSSLRRMGAAYENSHRVAGGVFVQYRSEGPSHSIYFVRFASPLCQIPHATWSIAVREDDIINLLDYVLDPGQDLVVLVCSKQLRLLSMRTGADHPRAPRRLLEARSVSGSACGLCQVKIGGKHICALQWPTSDPPRTVLTVWDWTTHEVIWEDVFHRSDIRCVDFLDEHHIITSGLSSFQPATITVRKLRGSGSSSASARFFLPCWDAQQMAKEMCIYCEPHTSWAHSGSTPTPFFPTSLDRLFVIYVYMYSGVQVAVAVLSSGLVSCFDDNASKPGEEAQIPWEAWVPQNAAVISTLFDMICVSGTKAVFPQRISNEPHRIFDFNEVRAHRVSVSTEEAAPQPDLPKLWDVVKIFQQQVSAGLPYVRMDAAGCSDAPAHRMLLQQVHCNSILYLARDVPYSHSLEYWYLSQ